MPLTDREARKIVDTLNGILATTEKYTHNAVASGFEEMRRILRAELLPDDQLVPMGEGIMKRARTVIRTYLERESHNYISTTKFDAIYLELYGAALPRPKRTTVVERLKKINELQTHPYFNGVYIITKCFAFRYVAQPWKYHPEVKETSANGESPILTDFLGKVDDLQEAIDQALNEPLRSTYQELKL